MYARLTDVVRCPSAQINFFHLTKTKDMKTPVRLLVLLSLLLLGYSATAANITITVGDNFYSPQTVTIRPGDVVTWQYQSGSTNTHPTASDNGAWTTFTINSANLTKTMTFSTVGAFPYHCTFHGAAGVGMYGVITVAAALPTTTAQDAATFQAYPNPASEAVTLKLDRTLAPTAVQLINELGSVVRTLELSPTATGTELLVSVADLPTGLYVYRLLANGAVVATRRLTVTH
jgi:plastocyanin